MKKLLSFVIAGSLFSVVLLTGCGKDDETQPENPSTSSDPRAGFIGQWAISENSSQTGVATYNVNIADSTNASYVLISYLWGTHTKVRATVSGSNISVPTQIVEGNSFSGSGTLANAHRINLTYYVNQGGSIDTVVAALTK